jgi:hypothetical protein
MSIRIMNDRFVGLRVQRTVAGEDKPRVKNFSYRIPKRVKGVTRWREATAEEKKKIGEKAKALDAQWEHLQTRARVPREFSPFDTRTNTGVKGIVYATRPDSQGYPVEAFRLYVSHLGKPKTAIVRLKRRTWREGWILIVDHLVKVKGLDVATQETLLARMPSERKLRK